jgi:glyoxylase-like metal-dependent hydrolase (beta-lactamase superfamily II)
MNIETFYFNPYRECTYVLVNDHKQAVIIDAGMYEQREQQRFAQYIHSNQLMPIALLITHAHPDHVCGQAFIENTYKLTATIQPSEGPLQIEGFDIQAISTPGHKEDCVCYYLPNEKMIFTGDTLFQESIGRTDLPGGDMGMLIRSLKKLTVLPEDTRVYPGHGYPTTIEHEKQYNPYL